VVIVIVKMKLNQFLKDGKLRSIDNVTETKAYTMQQFIETYAGPDV
jgi:hypothetical protein